MNTRFKKYLNEKLLSQKEFAQLAGVNESVVSRFCQGKVISSDNLVKLLSACRDLNLEYLFYGEGAILHGAEPGSSFTDKDRIIAQKDAMILKLQDRIIQLLSER